MEFDEGYPPQPRSIQIIRPDNQKFELNSLDEVKRIFESDKLKDHDLVVVSIAGDYRKGKSFLLNYFLRYLNAQYTKQNLLVRDWIHKDDDMVNRFSCRGGKGRDTIGIWMWSEIFTHEMDGRKEAIVLMDTQGIFDNDSDLKECISIFAMSMLLSSVQCFNVMRQVQENDLTNLQLFTEYARFAMKDGDEKPFQKLQFIIRDWSSPHDLRFGPSEGYVKDILAKHPKQTPEMHMLRDSIKNSFDEIDAFLMPYPGRAVAQSKGFVGKTKDLEPEFVKYVEKLTENLFDPRNLIRKKINGKTVQAAEFLELLTTYVDLFSGDELPQPISILQATADAHLRACYNECMDEYLNEMDNELEHTDVYLEENDLMAKHVKASEKAIARFRSRPKFGGLELQSNYLESLEKDIQKDYRVIHEKNEIEKVSVRSKQKTIFFSAAGGLAVAGAIGAVLVGGPIGLGLFTTYAAASNSMLAGLSAGGAAGGAIGGAGIGGGITKLLPRKWLGTDSALCETVKNLKESRKSRPGVAYTELSTSPERDATATSSASDIEMTPLSSDSVSNNAAQPPVNNTPVFTDSNAHTTVNRVTETIKEYLFSTPADRAEVAEFLRYNSQTNYFYGPKMIFNDIKDSILGLLPRSK